MRILFLFSNYHQKDFTGQPGTIWAVIQKLSPLHDVHLISNSDKSNETFSDGVYQWLFKSRGDQTLQYLSRLPYFVSKVVSIKPDFIHVHGLPLIIYTALISRITGKPFVCSFNEDIALRMRWFQRAIAQCINRSKGVFVSCGYFREILIGLGVLPKLIHVSPFGLKDDFLNGTDSAIEERTDIVFVGDARKSRGFDVVAKMAKAMPERTFLALIRWVSDSGNEDIAQLSKLPNVTILRYPYSKPLRELIQSAKVVVLPFRSTSPILPPMTLAEAMALGKCVATTKLKGAEELWGNSKAIVLIDANDPDGAARSVEEFLAQDEKRSDIGRNARQLIVKLFAEQYKPFVDFYQARGNQVHA